MSRTNPSSTNDPPILEPRNPARGFDGVLLEGVALSEGNVSPVDPLPRLLSTMEVAEWTGRCERTIRGWARAGLLQKRRIGRGTFYLAADVLALLDGSRDGGKTE